MIIDARRPRPKVLTLTSCRVQTHDNERKETQAKVTYIDAIQSTADNRRKENQAKGIYADAIQSTAI